MTLNDVRAYYGSFYKMARMTGISQTSTVHWKKIGYIPITMQLRLEKLTEGALKASLQDLGE